MANSSSTTSSMTSTSHTLTALPAPGTLSQVQATGPMANLLAAFAPSNRNSFIAPPPSAQNPILESVKSTLDTYASQLGEEQTVRLKELRKKRKRGEVDEETGEVLKIRKIHIQGFEVGQVWEQSTRVIDALRTEAEREFEELREDEGGARTEDQNSESGVELLKFGEDGFEEGSDDESMEDEEEMEGEEGEEEEEGSQEELDEVGSMQIMDEDEDDYEEEDDFDQEDAGTFTEDPNGLNDGFFSIDDFNKQTEFLEQADANADPYTGEASDEEDIDWDADPMAAPAKATSSSRRAAAMDIDDDEEESEEDDGDGPTFGNMDLNAPEGDSEDDADDSDVDVDVDTAGDNTNDILYKDFFEPPPRKVKKGERQAGYLERQSQKSKAQEPEDDDVMERAIADVRRDLFDDEQDHADSEDPLSDVDPADPRSRRSAHERRQLKLAEEIRRLEAASVAKREWTLSGEARAADRPQNSLLEEDLDFERTGKPVPVITAEVTESIEDLIKRRILAQEFDEVIRRRPDTLSNPKDARRGAFELDDTKNQQSLAEIYEEEHVKANNPDTYVSKADEKMRKEEREIEAIWKEASAKLDALSSWHYKPKPAAPSLTVVADVATVSMEDAQPTTASGMNGSQSMLAPQEIYKAGQEKESIDKGEVVPKSGAPVARQEMTREEKLRRRRREKERIKKRGGVEINQRPESKKSQKKRETVGDLKKGGVKVINRKGEIRDVDGNKVSAATAFNGAGGFKL